MFKDFGFILVKGKPVRLYWAVGIFKGIEIGALDSASDCEGRLVSSAFKGLEGNATTIEKPQN